MPDIPAPSGSSFFKSYHIILMVLFFGMIFINAIYISVQSHDTSAGVKYLGYSFVLSTEKLQDESLKVIERGSISPNTGDFLNDVWIIIKSSWSLLSAIFVIYMWLFIIARVLLFFPIADDSKKFTAWMFSILIFVLLQMAIIAQFTDKPFWTPILAFRDFGKAVWIILQPTVDKINEVTNQGMSNLSTQTNLT